MRVDEPQMINSFGYGRLVERSDLEGGSVSEEFCDSEELTDSEEFRSDSEEFCSDSEEFCGLEERSDSEEFSNSEKHSDLERPSKWKRHLELSIHEICHYRLGPALWTYCRDSDKGRDLDDLLMPLKSPTDILSNTFDKNFIGQMKLLAMIHEAGLLNFHSPLAKDPGLSSIINLLRANTPTEKVPTLDVLLMGEFVV